MDVHFLLVSDSMSINAKFPVMFIGWIFEWIKIRIYDKSYIYIHTGLKINIYTCIYVFFLLKYPWSKKNGAAFQLFLKYIIKQNAMSFQDTLCHKL